MRNVKKYLYYILKYHGCLKKKHGYSWFCGVLIFLFLFFGPLLVSFTMPEKPGKRDCTVIRTGMGIVFVWVARWTSHPSHGILFFFFSHFKEWLTDTMVARLMYLAFIFPNERSEFVSSRKTTYSICCRLWSACFHVIITTVEKFYPPSWTLQLPKTLRLSWWG